MGRTLVTRPVEVRVEGGSLVDFLNPRFVEEVRRTFPNVKFALLRIAIPREPAPEAPTSSQSSSAKGRRAESRPRYEPVAIGHYAPDHDEKRILTLDCEDPETLEAVERIVSSVLPAEKKDEH